MQDIKLSFVIPVYNVEKYLNECLESILSQITNQCEIILIDDGSTDTSGLICDNYLDSSHNIRVIHKNNGGSSSARNTGLSMAFGEYIAFVDSDDRIANGSVNKILEWIEKDTADICFMETIKFYPDKKTQPLGEMINRLEIRDKTPTVVFSYLATRPKYPGSACTKLFRRKFLEENRLLFPKDRRYAEDLGFCMDCFLCAKSFDKLDMPYYEYRQNREGSNTFQLSWKSFVDLKLFVTESVRKLCTDKMPISEICSSAMSFVAYEYSIMLWDLSRLSEERQNEAYHILQQYSWVLKFGRIIRLKIIHAVVGMFGIKFASKLLNKYMKMRR